VGMDLFVAGWGGMIMRKEANGEVDQKSPHPTLSRSTGRG
jgi:hypothetical protein